MNIVNRLALIACLALPFAACKKEEAPKEAVKAPLAAPTSADDRAGWNAYLSDVVTRNMEGIQNQPFVYTLPPESVPDFADQYERLLEKAKTDVARGIIAGNLLAYGGPSSSKMADVVVESFQDVQPNSMKGVRVLFIGDSADSARVEAAVKPAGVDYKFIEAK
ncbi:MAG TPA: hypothetical protein VHF86_04390 [Xanthomonadaceae bacterium]|nr:hypothetical protein [Xanthomonadaceae bacterium]